MALSLPPDQQKRIGFGMLGAPSGAFGKDWRSMLRHYSGPDGEAHAHFVLLKWGAAVLCPYGDEE
jgi:hypothetical protein